MLGFCEQCSWLDYSSPVSSLRTEKTGDRCGFGPGRAALPEPTTVGLKTTDASEEVGSHGTSRTGWRYVRS